MSEICTYELTDTTYESAYRYIQSMPSSYYMPHIILDLHGINYIIGREYAQYTFNNITDDTIMKLLSNITDLCISLHRNTHLDYNLTHTKLQKVYIFNGCPDTHIIRTDWLPISLVHFTIDMSYRYSGDIPLYIEILVMDNLPRKWNIQSTETLNIIDYLPPYLLHPIVYSSRGYVDYYIVKPWSVDYIVANWPYKII